MKRPIFFLVVISLLLFISLVQAVEIRGIVKDEKTGEPLAGVNVFVSGKPVGTATDDDGFFFFRYDTDEPFTLVFDYVGYKDVEKFFSPSDDLTGLSISLQQDVFRGEEVVVTGIASKTSKERAEVAVSRVTASDYTVSNKYSGVSQLINGKVAGVHVENSSGNVGGGIRFNVRSGGGLNGNEQPVIYVDGVRVDNAEVTGFGVGGQGNSTLSDLNPEDIENIEILKGPAGAASYGTNGANGVVLITTKRGQISPATGRGISIDYKTTTGFNQQSYEYEDDDFESFEDANKIFRDGAIVTHNLNISGGNNFIRYFASLDKHYEEGILPRNDMDRNNFRANIDVFPSETVTLRLNASYARNNIHRPDNDNSILGFLGNTLLFPTSYLFTDSASIFNGNDVTRTNRFIGSLQATWNPIKNFEARATIGMDEQDMRQDQTYPANFFLNFFDRGDRAIYNRSNRQYTFNGNVRYNYNITSDLRATSIAGAQLFDRKARTWFIEKETFNTELIMPIGAGAKLNQADEGFTHNREAGIYTEHSLAYQDQYFLTLGGRIDYAASIGDRAPNIFYPKASFALRLDQYNWFPNVFNLMKFRFAYGETGVLPGLTDGVRLLWTTMQSGHGVGAVPSFIGNTEIEPERVKEFEIGFESEIYTNYALEFTYYQQRASSSIIDFENSPSTGKTASAVPFNIGESKGWGVEGLFKAVPLRTRNFQVDFTVTSAYQDNEVLDLGDAQPIFDGFDVNVVKEGLPKHEFFTRKVIGANFDEDGVYSGAKLFETPDPDDDDRVSFGNPIPNYTGSFNANIRFLKNFNLYVLTDWSLGHKIYNNTRIFSIRFGNDPEWNNILERMGELEEAGNVNTDEYKSLADQRAKLDWRYDGNHIYDGDYFKLREISVSYSFKDLLSKVNARQYLRDLTLGFSAQNLWTTTDYIGADPEVNFTGSRSLTRGADFLTLQHPKTYNFWLRVSL